MLIELVGCTNAGKTTLARKIVANSRALGLDAVLGEDLVLERARLQWVHSPFLRRRAVEALSLLACLRTWHQHSAFHRFILRASWSAPGSWLYRLGIARQAIRKVGLRELLRQRSMGRIVLLDNDGVLQAVHNLFVHLDHASNESGLGALARLAPLPDVVAYVRQSEAVLIERTLSRGHHRIPHASSEEVGRFVRRAMEAFEDLRLEPAVAERLLVVDGERFTVAEGTTVGSPLMVEAARLIRTSLGEAGQVEGSSCNAAGRRESPKGAQPWPLALIERLTEAFEHRGVAYCHWKSNVHLAEAAASEQDLDLLVDRADLPQALAALAELGFKAAVVRIGRNPPGVCHYYGLDRGTGLLVHVHLFSGVVSGESFIKGHQFPFEGMLLAGTRTLGGIRLPSRPAELVVFVLRTFIKYGSWLDRWRLVREREAVRAELAWLREEGTMQEALTLLRKHCPPVEESLFLECVRAIEEGAPMTRRRRLARRMRRRLRIYGKYLPPQRLLAYLCLLAGYMRRRITCQRRNKSLQSGGAVVAFVGGDASGKSTLVAETAHWLGQLFVVRKVHFGKPSSSLMTFPLCVLLPLARRLAPGRRRESLALQETQEHGAPVERQEASLAQAVRAVALAWDRRRLALKVRRAAARGDLVICDRYPADVPEAPDGPRLSLETTRAGLARRLALFEKSLYRDIPPPDLVLRLTVSIETVRQRNRLRAKPDKHGETYLDIRHRQARSWQRTGSRQLVDLSTEGTFEDTMREARELIWRML